MKTNGNQAMRELRKIIQRTQGEFALMIGASKDAVASWEIGRNPLSAQYARRISLATGAEEKALRRGRGPLRSYVPFQGRVPFTAETFARHRSTYWGRSDEGAAREHLRHCADALGLVLLAAGQSGRGKIRHRLPGVLDSFIQWCERTREDFALGREIEALLAKRKFKVSITHRYGEWRRMQKEDPTACKAMGFKDDKRRSDGETLKLTREFVPPWAPGRSMRGGISKES
jgi:transcriptional regulator with XRE-family HTH domain